MKDVKFFEGDEVLDFINSMEESEDKTKLLSTASNVEVGSLIVGLEMEQQGKMVVYFRKFAETSIMLLGKGEELRAICERYVENAIMTKEEQQFIIEKTNQLKEMDLEFDSYENGT